MELTFRPALENQGETIFQMARELIQTYEDPNLVDLHKVLAWTRRKIETHIGEYTCVCLHEEPVGFYRFCPEAEAMELDDLYILPQFRGRGIGTAVINHCIAQGAPIELYVFTQNTGALRLYRRLGFEIARQVSPTRLLLRREVL